MSAPSAQSAKCVPTTPRHIDVNEEYQDAEENFQPKSPKFWTIIIGMYLSIFLVALVSIAGKEV